MISGNVEIIDVSQHLELIESPGFYCRSSMVQAMEIRGACFPKMVTRTKLADPCLLILSLLLWKVFVYLSIQQIHYVFT
jgi:hypothetical protein